MKEMQQRHIKPDMITYNATMLAFEKGEQWLTVLSLNKKKGDAAAPLDTRV